MYSELREFYLSDTKIIFIYFLLVKILHNNVLKKSSYLLYFLFFQNYFNLIFKDSRLCFTQSCISTLGCLGPFLKYNFENTPSTSDYLKCTVVLQNASRGCRKEKHFKLTKYKGKGV